MISIRRTAGIVSLAAAMAACTSLLSGVAAAGPSMLIDAGTGKVLAQDDAFQRWYPASLSKLMTTYVVFRAIAAGEVALDSPVRISSDAAKAPPSKMGYKPGSVLTLDNALKIIMVKSANDVSTAIAESIAGSEAAFAVRMNAESRRLGMTGSNWVNAHGLHDDRQYTTAHDLALLSLALRREFPQYAGYFSLDGIIDGDSKTTNHNTLIGRFDGADGMKTGYTCPAGFNVVASATRDGRTLLAIVIGSTSIEARAAKAADMLAAGFAGPQPGAPDLSTLTPPQLPGLDIAHNMRTELCTEAARKRLAEQVKRDAKGKPIVESPNVHDRAGEPVLVAVGLGGATGPESPFARGPVDDADVPIPTPRPHYTPVAASTSVQ